ncbi:MAG: hypothetical protein IPF73_13700 [Betaproteobacteria bacterium]|nr:hypothetical protein [Betaproteobacteria bacterium]
MGGRALAITFDDGTDFDWRDLPHPVHGLQRSLHNCLADFRAAGPRAREAHATSFVVVSREAREHLDRVGLAGRGWWTDAWWSTAAASGHAAIASHSWDHNHDLAAHLMSRAQDRHVPVDRQLRARRGRDRARDRAPQACRPQSRRPPVRVSVRRVERLPGARLLPPQPRAHRRGRGVRRWREADVRRG